MDTIKIDDEIFVSAKQLRDDLGINKNYATWIKKNIERAMLVENIDFIPQREQIKVGRPSTDYLLRETAALNIIVISGGKKAKEVRDEIIEIFQARKNLKLATVKEFVFAQKVVNCLKFIENQKEAKASHFSYFIKNNENVYNERFIYSEFYKYREKIIGWNKEQIDNTITAYLNEHVGHNKNKVHRLDMSTKLSMIDINEAIRVAVLDILYSKETDEKIAHNFANMCKEIAKEMEVEADKQNTSNLFKDKEQVDNIKLLAI